jgi:hypothetical protein
MPRDIPSPGQLDPRDRTLQNLGCLDTTRVSPDNRAELAARADYEHHLWTHGDPRGFYGQYPPAPV